MSHPILSICIPTYKHGDCLGRLLESIPDRHSDKIEICISNNASPDNTDEVVKKHMGRFPNFHYVKRDAYTDFDGNLKTVLSLPTTEYCWTIGSDDRLSEGALERVFVILREEKPGFLITPIIQNDVNHRWERKLCFLPPDIGRFSFNFGEKDRLGEYFDKAVNTAAVGGFISSNIFKRSLLLGADINYHMIEGYSHINLLFKMLSAPGNKDEKFLYLKEFLIVATANNCGVCNNLMSVKRRMFLDFHAFEAVGRTYLKDESLIRSFYGILRRQHTFLWLYRTMIAPECDNRELALLKEIFPRWWVWFMRHFSYRRHGLVHRFLRAARNFLRKSR